MRFWFFGFFLLYPRVNSIGCYFCTSMLNSNVDETAKEAMKGLLYSNYNIPPTHELCALPDDIEFRIVQKTSCEDDRCVRIQAFERNLHFVMRGCERALSKIGRLNGSCTTSSPSVCVCDTDLCNSSTQSFDSIAKILLTIIVFLGISRVFK